MPPKVKRGVKSQKGNQTKTKASRKAAKGNRTNRSRKDETPARTPAMAGRAKPPRKDHSKSKLARDKSTKSTQRLSTSEQFKRLAKSGQRTEVWETLRMKANADKSDDDAGNDDDDDMMANEDKKSDDDDVQNS